MVVRTSWVAALVAVIVALGIAAPLGSIMEPTIAPVSIWANPGTWIANIRTPAHATSLEILLNGKRWRFLTTLKPSQWPRLYYKQENDATDLA